MFLRNPAHLLIGKPKAKELAFKHERLSHDELIHGLREYVRLNKNIPAFYDEITNHPAAHRANLDAILVAIETADYNADIFEHPDCSNYLLYLIENKEIPYWVGITAYTYLMGLAQFTEKRQLKECDQDVKSIRKFEVYSLVSGEELSQVGERYICFVIKLNAKLGTRISYENIKKHILSLQKFEQYITVVDSFDYQGGGNQYDINKLLKVMETNVPFLRYGLNQSFAIPSFSMINYFLSQASRSAVQMKPILGKVGVNTRDQLHQKDQHPVVLYSNSISSNIPSVHNYRCGPIPALLHDIGHTYWGSLLGENARQFIYQEMVPLLDDVINRCHEMYEEEDSDQFPKTYKDSLTDYDLSPLNYYLGKHDKFSVYMHHWVDKTFKKHPFVATQLKAILLPDLEKWISKHEGQQDIARFVLTVKSLVDTLNRKIADFENRCHKSSVSEVSSASLTARGSVVSTGVRSAAKWRSKRVAERIKREKPDNVQQATTLLRK